jgi:hypothetical protein
MRHATRLAFVLTLCGCLGASATPVLYDIRDYGAEPDGETLCTQAIQEAVDHCAGSGGGVVYLPPGRWLSGTIVMKSGVTLQLDAGCTLLGSRDLAQYPPMVPAYRSYTDVYTDKSLIYAEKAERIAITGRGVIDGQGDAFHGPYKVRPYMIRLIGCRDVVVEDVTLCNSPMWVQHYLACDDVRIDGVTVRSRVNLNNDGIDIDSCRRVLVTRCNIDSGDDAIVLKSTSDRLHDLRHTPGRRGPGGRRRRSDGSRCCDRRHNVRRRRSDLHPPGQSRKALPGGHGEARRRFPAKRHDQRYRGLRRGPHGMRHRGPARREHREPLAQRHPPVVCGRRNDAGRRPVRPGGTG